MGVFWCMFAPMVGYCWSCYGFPRDTPRCKDGGQADGNGGLFSNNSDDVITGISYMFDGEVNFEKFKKCIVHDGVWYTNTNTCSVDVKSFPNIANDNPNLEYALKKVSSGVTTELLKKYEAVMAAAGLQRHQIVGRDIRGPLPQFDTPKVVLLVYGLLYTTTLIILAWIILHKSSHYLEKQRLEKVGNVAVGSIYKDKVNQTGLHNVDNIPTG